VQIFRVAPTCRRALAGTLLTITALVQISCSLRREQDPIANSDPLRPVQVESQNGDAGRASASHLSVLLKLEGETIAVEKVERVSFPLRQRQGARSRRGLLLIALDSAGARVHREVVIDPRLQVMEVPDESGALHPVPSGTSAPKSLLVRVPAEAHQLLIYDASEGALDAQDVDASAQARAVLPGSREHRLLITLPLEVK
jgi:hypothetical protein